MVKRQPSVSVVGCGWLGAPLAENLLQAGFRVLGSTTTAAKKADLEKKGIEMYILEAQSSLSGGLGFQRLFDAEILVLNIPPSKTVDYAAQMTTIIDMAKEGKVQKILYASSTGVYGSAPRVLTEKLNLNPEHDRSKAILESEDYVKESGLDYTILRFAGLVGGSRQAGRYLAGRKNLTGGQNLLNLVHLDDCVAITSQIITEGHWNQTYNVCSDEHPIRKDFYIVGAVKLGLEPPTFVDEPPVTEKRIVSNEKLKRDLNYTFLHPDPVKF